MSYIDLTMNVVRENINTGGVSVPPGQGGEMMSPVPVTKKPIVPGAPRQPNIPVTPATM